MCGFRYSGGVPLIDDGCGGFMIGNVRRVCYVKCDFDGSYQRNDCEKLNGVVKGWSGME